MLPELGLPCPLPASPHFWLVHKSAASHHPSAPADPCVINAHICLQPGENPRYRWERKEKDLIGVGRERRREDGVIPHCH